VTLRIGLCEDDDELRGVIRTALEREGHEIRATASGTEALRMFTDSPPDVLILDIGLPDADGRDVCMALRANGGSCPVLFLTARSAVSDRVSGFHSGGDDYLAKPFALSELLVRVAALAKRARSPDSARPNDRGVTLDPAAHALRRGNSRVMLTPTEFRLMAALVARPNEVMRRAALIATAWPDGAIVHNNTLDAYMARIRRKLREVDPDATLETVRGVGYVLR
jgi:two-component system, OmpR family, response regulator